MWAPPFWQKVNLKFELCDWVKILEFLCESGFGLLVMGFEFEL